MSDKYTLEFVKQFPITAREVIIGQEKVINSKDKQLSEAQKELEEEREIKSISISALKEIANSYHGVYGVTAKEAAIEMNGRAEEALMKIDEVYSNGN